MKKIKITFLLTVFLSIATITNAQMVGTPYVPVDCPTVSAASSSPAITVNTAMTAITHTTTGASGIGTAEGLPNGVTATWANNIITISGTPSQTGTFNYQIPLTGACGTMAATGTIIVYGSLVAGTPSANQTICYNTTPAQITGGAATGGNGAYTYQWQSSTTSATSGWTNISGSTSANYTPPSALTATTYYRREVTSGTYGTVDGSAVTVTVNGNFTQSNPSAATICYNTTNAFSLAAATGGSGTITYQWQSSTDNSTWANISGATSASYTTPALTANTYYRRQATAATCGGTISSGSALVTVTSLPAQPSTITGWTVVEKGATSLKYSVTNVSGVTYNWTLPSGWTKTAGGTTNSIIVTAPTTTGNYTITVTPSNNSCNGTARTLSVRVGCGAYNTSGKWLDFMCYNLGADTSIDPMTSVAGNADGSGGTFGYLYEWGRKEDGHQKRTSGTTSTLATSDNPGHANFITNPNVPYDWRSPKNDNLWGATKTANDPCPSGWRIPTQAEWGSIFMGGTTTGTLSSATANTWTSITTGTSYGVKIGSALFLPYAGFRDYDGNFATTSINDFILFYWSSTPHNDSSYYLRVYFTDVSPGYDGPRAGGLSVRCIAQ